MTDVVPSCTHTLIGPTGDALALGEPPALKRPRMICLSDEDAARIAEIMRSEAPVEVEIGCGKSLYIVTRADRERHRHFIGVDTAERYLRRGRRRSLRRNLANLILAKTDARDLVRRMIPPGRVSAFHVNFPDPWPKRRHQDRRLLGPGFLAELRRRLVPGGRLLLATDVDEYFRWVRDHAQTATPAWSAVRASLNVRPDGDPARSGYENRCRSRGVAVYYLELIA